MYNCLLPVFTVTTDCWHYKYSVWLRRFWGQSIDINHHKACPYYQRMCWCTIGLVLASPVLLYYYLIIGVVLGLIYLTDKLSGCSVFQFRNMGGVGQLGQYDRNPEEIKLTKFERGIAKCVDGIDAALDTNAAQKVFYGLAGTCVLTMIVGLCFMVYMLGCLAVGHAVPTIIHYLPRLPGDIWNFLIGSGDNIFWGFAHTAGGLTIAAEWLCGGIAYLWNHVCYGLEWFFTNGPLWAGIAKWAGYTVAGMIASSFVVYCFYEINSSPWMTKRKELAAKRKKVRDTARKERDRLMQVELERLKAEMEAEKGRAAAAREKLPPKQKSALMLWVSKTTDNIFANLFGTMEQIGPIAYKSLGIFPLISTMSKAAWNGVCPQIVFITPEEMAEQRRLAEEARKVAVAKRIQDRAIQHAKNELIRKKIDERNGKKFVPIPFDFGTSDEVIAQAQAVAVEEVGRPPVMEKTEDAQPAVAQTKTMTLEKAKTLMATWGFKYDWEAHYRKNSVDNCLREVDRKVSASHSGAALAEFREAITVIQNFYWASARIAKLTGKTQDITNAMTVDEALLFLTQITAGQTDWSKTTGTSQFPLEMEAVRARLGFHPVENRLVADIAIKVLLDRNRWMMQQSGGAVKPTNTQPTAHFNTLAEAQKFLTDLGFELKDWSSLSMDSNRATRLDAFVRGLAKYGSPFTIQHAQDARRMILKFWGLVDHPTMIMGFDEACQLLRNYGCTISNDEWMRLRTNNGLRVENLMGALTNARRYGCDGALAGAARSAILDYWNLPLHKLPQNDPCKQTPGRKGVAADGLKWT